MRFLDEYREPKDVETCLRAIRQSTTKPWTLMEICGGQTHSIVRNGLDRLLPAEIELVHGPGCPVCVTPIHRIDQAIALSQTPGCIVCSFGDMLRVPGTGADLLKARAMGGQVRVVYSPLDAVQLAIRHPEMQVVFFAVGFETTAPANALAVRLAHDRDVRNFSLLVAHVCVPPAMEAILSSSANRVQGFLAAGHVCAVMGTWQYPAIAEKHRVPIVVTGFEPLDIMLGVLRCVRQLESGRFEVENAYARAVQPSGNSSAMQAMDEVFEIADQHWRGIGLIPQSGLRIRQRYECFDADVKFGLAGIHADEATDCRSAEILQGRIKPPDCPAFGQRCTPESPLGAPMVSSEGACAAYYRYRAHAEAAR